MNILNIIKLVTNKKVNNIKPCYDMTGKRFIYCNGELITYREIMKLKRQLQLVSLVAVFTLIVCYCFILKLLLV